MMPRWGIELGTSAEQEPTTSKKELIIKCNPSFDLFTVAHA